MIGLPGIGVHDARNRRSSWPECAIVAGDAEFRPTDDLKKLYRQLAKLVHPDLAPSERERARRTGMMAEANRAYAHGDIARLRALLDEWELSPESVPGDDVGADLVRTIRKIDQVERRLVVLGSEIADLKHSDLYSLKERADASARSGQDLLEQLAEQLKAEIRKVRGQSTKVDEAP